MLVGVHGSKAVLRGDGSPFSAMAGPGKVRRGFIRER
jgi:hypothetical protein